MKMEKHWKRFFTLDRHHAEGFTLVELIVVIAILAILGGVAVPAYSGYVAKAERSADEQLLASVNTAFASACAINGADHYNLDTIPVIVLSGETGAKSVEAVSIYNDDFMSFFDISEDAVFKTYASLYFNSDLAMFMEGTEAYAKALEKVLNEMSTQLGAVNGSAFAEIGIPALLEQIDGVSTIAQLSIMNGGGILDVVMAPDYMSTLAGRLNMTTDELTAKLGEMEKNDPEGMVQFLANSTVLNVATTMNDPTKFNEAESLSALQSGGFTDLKATLDSNPETGLAQAALLYGMYTAYNPDGATDVTNVDTLLNITKDQGFAAYLSEINTEGSQANKDYEGYKAALEIVNTGAADEDVANNLLTNGYDDAELSALIQQALNSQK